MSSAERVEELVNTRINGNQIRGSNVYMNKLSRVSKPDINEYADLFGMPDLYGTKLEMLEQIRDHICGERRGFE